MGTLNAPAPPMPKSWRFVPLAVPVLAGAVSREKLFDAARLLHQHDLKALWIFLLGGPQETPETVNETLSFVAAAVPPPNAVNITAAMPK